VIAVATAAATAPGLRGPWFLIQLGAFIWISFFSIKANEG
jgi:hypothetical protein